MVNVQLVVKKFAERGSDVALYCENDAAPDILYKVSHSGKISHGVRSFFAGTEQKE